MKRNFTQPAGVALLCLLFSIPSNAQNTSPYWSLAGNSNVTSTTKFGTTNAQNLRILTNNIERMRVTSAGNIGIGTITAPNKLTVGGSASFANVVGVNGASNNLYSLSVTAGGTKSGIIVNNAGNYPVLNAVKNGTGYGIYVSNNTTSSFTPIIAANATGTADGISGSSVSGYGATGRSSNSVGIYGSSTNYFGVFAVSNASVGVYGQSTNSRAGYFISTYSDALLAKTLSAGRYAGVFEGSVYTYGTYSTSDGRLKKEVKDVTGGLDAIMKLKPKNYQFRHDGQFEHLNLPLGTHYGFIAQELEEVLPWAVEASEHDISAPDLSSPSVPGSDGNRIQAIPIAQHRTEMMSIKAINYTEIIPVVVRGIQEQQETISTLKETVVTLKEAVTTQQKQIEKLTELVSKLSREPIAINLSSAYLEQNAPNPPKGNTTRIGYYIPETANQSALVLFDASGKKLKEVQLSQTGHGFINLNTGALAQGSYSYSLLVDGRLSDTKKLLVAR